MEVKVPLRVTPIERTGHFANLGSGMHLGAISGQQQASNVNLGIKYKTKIYLPKGQGVNFVGLIIGPKGIY